MKPWIVERIERERAQREWQPTPLHIQQPPPEWIEEQERRRERDRAPDRGVCIIGERSPADRGVTIIEM